MNHPPTGSRNELSTAVGPITRRRFLAFSGVTAAGALAVGATQVNWGDLVSAAARTPLDPAAGVLVMVTLYGGNDGLNTVIPAADPAYRSRPQRVGVRAGDGPRPGRGARSQSGPEGPAFALAGRATGHRPRRRLPEAGPQPFPVDGHLADRGARRRRPPADGWAGGSTPRRPTRWLALSLDALLAADAGRRHDRRGLPGRTAIPHEPGRDGAGHVPARADRPERRSVAGAGKQGHRRSGVDHPYARLRAGGRRGRTSRTSRTTSRRPRVPQPAARAVSGANSTWSRP